MTARVSLVLTTSSGLRETPVVETEGADFGVDGIRLIHKPELLQHSGSFKVRGAFANLLMKKPAKIFVPTVASPAKMERIRG
ncbi:MAG TPA: hypothetical protein VN868_05920 [Terriglobales bacterium]|nr:hypothetical protein [Terriglobales bacterium]